MRISSIDHLRGIGIILVLVFSLWQWMYHPQPFFNPLVHIVGSELHAGDFVFPLFLFCSGASLWLYARSLKARGGKLEQAERKYLGLLLASLAICGMRLFVSFPDEVVIIAACALISVIIFWNSSLQGILLSALALCASFAFLAFFFPAFLSGASGDYLGGWLGIPYFLPVFLFGFMVSQAAFPQGKFSGIRTYRTLSVWLLAFSALTLASSLAWQFDRSSLSPSFLPLSMAISTLALLFFTWLCESAGFHSQFLALLGQNSLWGWALLAAITSAFWLLEKKGEYPSGIYLPFCALLVFMLYAALLALGKVKKS